VHLFKLKMENNDVKQTVHTWSTTSIVPIIQI
jgi:hypothetical protein